MIIRAATDADRDFIFGLAPTLIEVAKLSWHSDEVLNQFQNRYIEESLDKTEGSQAIFIAERDGVALGFIQVVEITEEISQKMSANIPLLAVTKDAQGAGVGRRLMDEAEKWAKAQGYHFLQLDVFYNNDHARAFYEAKGFQNDTIVMVKTLED